MAQSVNTLSYFGLTKFQLRVLFSLEYWLLYRDALHTQSFMDKLKIFKAPHENKLKWAMEFKKQTQLYLKGIEPKDQDNDLFFVENKDTYNSLRQKISEENPFDNTWKSLILLECSLFQPYYPLSMDQSDNKDYRGLCWDENERKKILGKIAKLLGIEEKYISIYQDTYKKAISRMMGTGKKIIIAALSTAMISAIIIIPFITAIAPFFAAPGLVGIAAINSGLAALGGGAIAAGGFGIVGGIAAIVGGGALIGGGLGAGAMTLASSNPDLVMGDAAKITVVIRDILIIQQHNLELARKVYEELTYKLNDFQHELVNLKNALKFGNGDKETIKKQIKNIEKIIESLERLIKYLRGMLKI